MKKIILSITIFMLMIFQANATDWNSKSALIRVNTIGNKLLKANNVNYDIEFKVSESDDINAYANINKEIYVHKGLLQYVDNDSELAGVIGHEMGHIINGHCAKQSILSVGIAIFTNLITNNRTLNSLGQKAAVSKISRHDEMEADITGVDLMYKAGYNPLAMVSLLNKISGNYIDILMTHPSGEKRILNVYNYIEYNYPNSLKYGFNSDSYNKALVMITPSIEKRKQSPRYNEKFVSEQQKLLENKEKRAKKMQGKSSSWEGYYRTLQYLAN